MDPQKPSLFGYVMVFLIVALVLVFAVAFVHDLFTGQLPGSGDPCSQYSTDAAKEACFDGISG